MKNRGFLFVLIAIALLTAGILFAGQIFISAIKTPIPTSSISLKQISQQIAATGSVHSQQEATLNFQIGGKLVYLPFKAGDSVSVGQTIAQLDTTALQKELQIEANAFQIAANTNATTQEDNQAAVIEGQTRAGLDTYNHNNYPNITEAQVVSDTVSRLVQNSMLSQNTAQLNVDLANYALQLASLTAPFSGIITHEDVTTPNINVTTTTSFTIVDPTEKVFRADVDASDIDFVSVGAKATVSLDGFSKQLTGTVITVYPQKKTLASGQQIYEVDIQMDSLPKTIAFGQNGSVLITSNNQMQSLLVPSWAIIGHNSVWVWDGQKAVLKTIQTGVTHGDMTEVVSGLSTSDKVITLPEAIAKQQYHML